MKLEFQKMHSLGNDFMVIDGVRQKFNPHADLIQHFGNRNTGIGFDQLLLIEAAKNSGSDFIYRIFNADGTEVSQCGNGARCIMRFLQEQQLTKKNVVIVETKAGKLELKSVTAQQYTVNMGIPFFDPKKIPFLSDHTSLNYSLLINDKTIDFFALSIGNPHCIVQTNDIITAPVATLGFALSNHPSFPEKTNVGFMKILNARNLELRVYERGTGETLACGSGACAAVIAGRSLGLLDSDVTVHLPGGSLSISWEGENSPVYQTGSAVNVFKGIVEYDES